MYGLAQRGEKGDGDFRPGDGGGFVAARKADYEHALSRGSREVLLREEGAFSNGAGHKCICAAIPAGSRNSR